MAFYETQLAGVVVGGLLAFLLTWVLRIIESLRLKVRLQAGINVEMQVISDWLLKTHAQLVEHSSDFDQSHRYNDRDIDISINLRFIDANIGQVGSLDTALIRMIIQLSGKISEYLWTLKVLHEDALLMFGKGSVDSLQISNTFRDGLKMNDGLRKLCDEIIRRT